MRCSVLAILVLLSAAMVLVGCGGSTGADPAKLEGSWRLEAFGGVTDVTPADPAVVTDLVMKAGEASGSGGVNSYSTTYEADGDSLKFGEIASTMMAGEPAAMDQEAKFFKALADTRHYEFNEGKLILTSRGNDTLVVLVAK
jgi:putative lipoprotein